MQPLQGGGLPRLRIRGGPWREAGEAEGNGADQVEAGGPPPQEPRSVPHVSRRGARRIVELSDGQRKYVTVRKDFLRVAPCPLQPFGAGSIRISWDDLMDLLLLWKKTERDARLLARKFE